MARPRVLDIDRAMDTATQFFWKNGYERTSVADLTQAMGITPPSFYFAFGSKDGLFLRVLENYLATRMSHVEAALQEQTARAMAELMLRRMADLYSDDSHPRGCLVVNCSLAGGTDPGPIREEMGKYRSARRGRLRARLQRARDEGDLPADADADELAGFIMTVGWGMALDAQGGASREQLYRTVAWAMKAWPGSRFVNPTEKMLRENAARIPVHGASPRQDRGLEKTGLAGSGRRPLPASIAAISSSVPTVSA